MKLKPFVFPFLYLSLIFTLVLGLYFTSNALTNEVNDSLNDITYVSSVILNDVIPVINVSSTVINPYNDETVSISKYFYNMEDDSERQKESLIYFDDTYMPNTGIDYISQNKFDVISILEGTVIDIKEDEILGKIVEIKHDNEIISSYGSLSEINVQKGEIVNQGVKIGVSGNNKITPEGNNLHLEIYQNGLNIDPLKIIGKNIGDF